MTLSSRIKRKLAAFICLTARIGKSISLPSESYTPIFCRGFQHRTVEVGLYIPVKFLRDFYQHHHLTDQLGVWHLQHRELLKCICLTGEVINAGATLSTGVLPAHLFFDDASKESNFVEKDVCNFELSHFIRHLIAFISFNLSLVLRVCDSVSADDSDDASYCLQPIGPLGLIEVEPNPNSRKNDDRPDGDEHVDSCQKFLNSFHKGILT